MIKKIKKQHEINEEEDDPVLTASESQAVNSSVLFEGYRSLGYYASDLPISLVKSGEDHLIASVIGEHAFYVYDTAHLNLTYMSRFIPETILCIQATADGFVYTALREAGSGKCLIVCWKKMHRVAIFEVPDGR
jgi:hypothetical protein